MSDLEEIRSKLKRARAYDPDLPMPDDLVIQFALDLAVLLNVDAFYILETLERIAEDAGDNVTRANVLGALFEVLAPYQTGKSTHAVPVTYCAFRVNPDHPWSPSATLKDLILDFAIAECGWPMGTHVADGSRYELNYGPKNRRAYVLGNDERGYLVPRYDAALIDHIEGRDRDLYGLAEEDDSPFSVKRFSDVMKRLNGLSISTAPRTGKTAAMLAATKNLTSMSQAFGISMSDAAQAMIYAMSASQKVRAFDLAVKELPKGAFVIDSIVFDPPSVAKTLRQLRGKGEKRPKPPPPPPPERRLVPGRIPVSAALAAPGGPRRPASRKGGPGQPKPGKRPYGAAGKRSRG